MIFETTIGDKSLELVQGDITLERIDAIVNAANTRLAGGGGVDGAIHLAGGPAIMSECDAIRADRGGCPTGEAVATTAGRLNARYVIHTAGPVWSGGSRGEPELLAHCYASSLRLADELGCRSVAFPSISTGVYRFPIEMGARIALDTIVKELPGSGIALVRFVLFSKSDLEIYAAALDKTARHP